MPPGYLNKKGNALRCSGKLMYKNLKTRAEDALRKTEAIKLLYSNQETKEMFITRTLYDSLPEERKQELVQITQEIQQLSKEMYDTILAKKEQQELSSDEETFFDSIKEDFDKESFWNVPEKTGYGVVINLAAYVRVLVPYIEKIVVPA